MLLTNLTSCSRPVIGSDSIGAGHRVIIIIIIVANIV